MVCCVLILSSSISYAPIRFSSACHNGEDESGFGLYIIMNRDSGCTNFYVVTMLPSYVDTRNNNQSIINKLK